ncbi:MAG: hypothetical protein EXS22_10915 [Pedosphaera sp.]|nr:hypothetical protein [Pedosphaera sp.]
MRAQQTLALFFLTCLCCPLACDKPAVPSPQQATAPTKPERNATVVLNDNATAPRGVIAHVQSALSFCIVEFPGQNLPAAGQSLWVYRADQRVGELMVSSDREQTFVIAEIRQGQLQAGDEVRDAAKEKLEK